MFRRQPIGQMRASTLQVYLEIVITGLFLSRIPDLLGSYLTILTSAVLPNYRLWTGDLTCLLLDSLDAQIADM